jgi:hypothetical protein
MGRHGGASADRNGSASTSALDLRWDTIPAADAAANPGRINGLIAADADGMTVTGIYTEDEIARALPRLEAAERIERPFGWLLGMPIGMCDAGDEARQPYYDDAKRCKDLYTDAFGFDPHERLCEILQPMSGPLALAVPEEDGRPYLPGQVRWWEPDRGGLPAHVGNEFREQLADGAMSHLLTTTSVTDHLSYFVVLQRAEVGGALSVYDLLWEQNRGSDDWAECERNDSWILEAPCRKFDVEPGSLIIFGGGWRWHRVDPPSGSRPRITYGGFAAPSVDGSELHFWA